MIEQPDDISYPPVEPEHMDMSDIPNIRQRIVCAECGKDITWDCGHRTLSGKRLLAIDDLDLQNLIEGLNG